MPSADMLKKLLDEFVEKEALILEELKAIDEQIKQLAGKLESCNDRLARVGADRSKVDQMRVRYCDSNGFELASAMPVAQVPEKKVAQPADTEKSAQAAPAPAPVPVPVPEPAPVEEQPPIPAQAIPPIPAQAIPPIPGSVPGPGPVITPLTGNVAETTAPPAADTAAQPAAEPGKTDAAAAEKKQGTQSLVDLGTDEQGPEDDTVKSINDALRSLFR